ncbi:FadR/GntR family transcriptional regulator [Rhizobium sp. RAF56]|uniref:FadR/GntR family transcriptional regulator n=1 Tax=Rhizobium sp. RAF56 TaxID=3233062 RepID=UPI003F9D5AA6
MVGCSLEPLDRPTLAGNAVDAIRAEIVASRWAVGNRLPNEATLSAMLSVSRGTIREAVRMLVAKGYLETRQGSGTYVRSAVDPAETLLRTRRAGLRDLFEARCALDVEAARLAAIRHTPAGVADLRALLARRGNSGDTDRATFVARDLAFHKAVIAASGNRAMIEIYEFFSASIRETIEATLCDDVPEPDLEAHAAIIDAIASGDPAKADAAVRGFMDPVLASLDRMLLS